MAAIGCAFQTWQPSGAPSKHGSHRVRLPTVQGRCLPLWNRRTRTRTQGATTGRAASPWTTSRPWGHRNPRRRRPHQSSSLSPAGPASTSLTRSCADKSRSIGLWAASSHRQQRAASQRASQSEGGGSEGGEGGRCRSLDYRIQSRLYLQPYEGSRHPLGSHGSGPKGGVPLSVAKHKARDRASNRVLGRAALLVLHRT
jgi:hypothetical protein